MLRVLGIECMSEIIQSLLRGVVWPDANRMVDTKRVGRLVVDKLQPRIVTLSPTVALDFER